MIMNDRDHRKILVVDGKIAHTGGYNIADEYINEVERFGYWKDAGIRVTGECVNSFTTMFLEMWNYINRTGEVENKYLVKKKTQIRMQRDLLCRSAIRRLTMTMLEKIYM